MSAWPGKYVIGLTGNIATGKSVVRKMLEHLGAYGIDADALGHRAIAKGAPGYQPVLNIFGKWILFPDGQIDRSKLARIVFADADALASLEAVIHPLVSQAVDLLVRRSRHKVIVIEAIKLLESGLRAKCDTTWVVYAPEKVQMARLMQKRGLKETSARQRISAQPAQEYKLSAADVVIRNEISFDNTWNQVFDAWMRAFPTSEPGLDREQIVEGEIVVQRAGPRQAEEIANFITKQSNGSVQMSRENIMAAFGEKAFLLLRFNGKLVGLAGWQVENLVARTGDIYFEPDLPFREAMRALTEEIERASRELQCEAALMFLPTQLANERGVLRSLGYQPRTVDNLGVRVWEEAAVESMPSGTSMFFKQLRKDRVLRPV